MTRTAKGLDEAVAFFYEHAGHSYMPGKETEEQGRQRGAEQLAIAEAWLEEQDGDTEWSEDDHQDRSGIDHAAPLYCCTVKVACTCSNKCCSGERFEHLGGIDLGDNGDNSDGADAYKRVVEAELALELMGQE